MIILDSEGLKGLSIRKISARLSIAPSTIYNYYKNKEVLINALTKKRLEEAFSSIDEKLKAKGEVNGNDIVNTMDFIVDELRVTLREIIVFYISSTENLYNSNGYTMEHIKMISNEIGNRIRIIIGADDDRVKILTNLVFACIYSKTLKFSNIYNTIVSI